MASICWSAENATKAYIKTMKMVSPQVKHKLKEPDVAEFVSALAAGNNAQLMVIACAASDSGCSAAAGLMAAAHQTGGRVVCIFRSENESLDLSKHGLNPVGRVEFVSGDAKALLMNEYKEADFIVVDCNLNEHEEMLNEARLRCARKKGAAIVLGYNALCRASRTCGGAETQLLPIGGGLLMTRITAVAAAASSQRQRDPRINVNGGSRQKSNWVVKVDKCTGEEHVFRVRSPRIQGIRPIAC
ncbi:uncharacterized protein LOC124925196 [Impatiens glandulifera]|uniref:uncharacterized protein LOC124925196 n=1 Tax=Impatiens glandulifera TaxID=253017 RepID=UPI001FB0E58E|nr:uncharacterized protein LOC124925196 [Impatiens glandulifera]